MANFTGRSKPIQYLFQNGGGGGSSTLDGLSDVNLTTPTNGQVLKYDANADEWVNANESGGGGGIVNDGTVGVKIDVTIPANSSVTYTFDDLGITKRGYYIIGCASNRTETSGGWKWFGYMAYSGYYTSSYQTSYIKSIDYSYTGVTMSESAETITFANQLQWNMGYSIEVLPLHPKIEVEKHAYSTTEQVVGTWIDGKPIYEISFSQVITGMTSGSQYQILDLTASAIDNVVKIDGGYWYETNNTADKRFVAQGQYCSLEYADNGNILYGRQSFTSTTSNRSYTWIGTIRYTKTTD